jgi:hypothetical protein
VIRPLKEFEAAVETVLDRTPFRSNNLTSPVASVRAGDARELDLPDGSIDVVITSPPYLNAIDYLRCSKFSLIWLGHKIAALRKLRAGNIGTEVSLDFAHLPADIMKAVKAAGDTDSLACRDRGMLARYAVDMDRVVAEIARVLNPEGRCVAVVGDCTMRGVFVRNSALIENLAAPYGLQKECVKARPLPANRRYLPPPCSNRAGDQLSSRMREEIVLTLVKK